jgi:hypothetical protein
MRVIPAKAGIQTRERGACRLWIPAFAGMTDGPANAKPTCAGWLALDNIQQAGQ